MQVFTIFAKYKSKTIFQVFKSCSMFLDTVKHYAAQLVLAIFIFPLSLSAQGTSSPGLHTVVIDPGHGGKDPGCVSKDGKTQEKALVLDISRRLQKKIEDTHPDVKVLLTRTDDRLIPLIDRAKYATKKNADFFISIHINATARSNSANGYSVHLLGPSNDKSKDTYAFNMEVCKRENEVILLEDNYSTTYQGFDPNEPESDIFLHLMHNAYREQSLMFGQIIDEKLKKGPFKKSNGIFQNNFAVLRLATMPAMLLELGFITSSSDLTVLRNNDKIEQIASLLSEAFTEYKSIYDESVGVGGTQTAATTVVSMDNKKGQDRISAEQIPEDTPCFGTQILATSKARAKNDPCFLGYEAREIRDGNLYKYIIGTSESLEKAKEMYKNIKKTYPDSFIVKVDNGSCIRQK